MFRYLALSGSEQHAAPGGLRPDVEIMPAKTEKASRLLADLARLIRGSGMDTEEKKAAKDMVHQVITNMYEREVKDEWAELEEME
jgi:hypothetical protein